MADEKVPGLDGFEESEVSFPEIIALKPGEEPVKEEADEQEEKITLSKEEYEALRKGTDSTGALLEGFKGLQEALKAPSQPVNVQQQVGESDEDFEKRLEKELFSEGKTGKAVKEAIQRYGGGQVSQLMGIISQQNRQIIEMHPEKSKVFNRYKGEIEGLVKGLPQDQQFHPQVWDYALEQIKAKHRDELDKESIDSQVAAAVEAKLKELGIESSSVKPGGVKEQSRGSFVESGRGSSVGTGAVQKRKVYATAAEIEEAQKSGVSIEHYLRKIGKI